MKSGILIPKFMDLLKKSESELIDLIEKIKREDKEIKENHECLL